MTGIEVATTNRVEVYARKADAAFAAQAEAAATASKEAGLNALAERAGAWCAARNLKTMTLEEIDVWQLWLPAVFSSEPSRSLMKPFSLSDYEHSESMPLNIKVLLAEAKKVFSAVEIRAPYAGEKSALVRDPILIGIIDWGRDRLEYVLLARWAENNADLLPFDDIKRIVHARDGRFPLNPRRLLIERMRDEQSLRSNWWDLVFMTISLTIVSWLLFDSLLPLWFLPPLLLVALWRFVKRRQLKKLYPSVADNI